MVITLLALLALLVLAEAIGTSLVVQVTRVSDTVANITSCTSEDVSVSSCNLRSALAYCSQEMRVSEDTCVVNITTTTVVMDSTLGEIEYSTNGSVVMYGNGGTVVGEGSRRLLSVDATATGSGSGSVSSGIHVYGLKCSGFGGRSSAGSVGDVVGGGESHYVFVIFGYDCSHSLTHSLTHSLYIFNHSLSF
jgi:hypothetical protein